MPSLTDQVEIVIRANADQAKTVFESLDSSLKQIKESAEGSSKSNQSFSSSNQAVAASAAASTKSLSSLVSGYVSLAAAIGGVSLVLRQALSDAEAERIGLMRLQSVLEATGRSHEITAGQIDAMAQKLEDYANQDKQAVMDAAARLATYDNIASDLFSRLLQSASDLSAVFGTDISSAISDLGRVMEDPLDGLTRLRRQGIMISSETENQIQSLIEQNRLYDAQILILDEIDSKVGGVAEKMADVAGGATFLTAWNKFVGELGNTIGDATSELQQNLAEILQGATSALEFRNLIRSVGDINLDDVLSLDTANLTDTYNKIMQVMAMENSGFGVQENTILHVTQRDLENSGVIAAIERELEARERLRLTEEAEAEAADKAAREKEEATQRRIAQLDTEVSKTSELTSLYIATEEGQKADIEKQIAAVQEMMAADERYLASLMHATSIDQEVYDQVMARWVMYDPVLKALNEELAAFNEQSEILASAPQALSSKILGMSASDYVQSIPVSFDLDGRSQAETIEEQMAALRTVINSYNKQKPVDEDALEEWQADMDVLVAKYNELKALSEDISYDESLRLEAQAELNKLLSDEEAAQIELESYSRRLKEMLDEKLITQEQFNALLEIEKESLGLSTEELSDWQKALSSVGDELAGFLQKSFSVESVSNDLYGLFQSIGEAWASNTDGADAAMDSFGDFAQQLTMQLSTLFISAGLRIIAEMGIAGLPLGLALIAAGGLTGIASAAMGGSSAALDESILNAMEDEVEARQKLAESLNESIDTEYDLLKRQLERNLISEETFRSEAEELQHQRDVIEARAQISEAIYDRIAALNNEYSGMSGWDKFWSGRDEDIKDDIGTLQSYFDLVASSSEEELRKLMEMLKDMDVSLGNVPAFATGGEFITNGPQLIKVGDNPSGRERVKITPLDRETVAAQTGSQTIITITGDVYGIEDLYGKLQSAGIKLARRMR